MLIIFSLYIVVFSLVVTNFPLVCFIDLGAFVICFYSGEASVTRNHLF